MKKIEKEKIEFKMSKSIYLKMNFLQINYFVWKTEEKPFENFV